MKLTKDMSNPIRAVAVFNDKKINGAVHFTEEPSNSRIRIDVSISGLKSSGFHGFHVFSGVIINIIIFFNVLLGTYEKRRSYEMVEKVGLYWHFVDLVWVFVFTVFYLV